MASNAVLDFLNKPIEEVAQPNPNKLTDEQFKELTAQIDEIRTKITSGQEASVEDARLIVVYFRARREKLFTVKQEKAKKPKAEKKAAPKRKATKAQIANMDALELLKDL